MDVQNRNINTDKGSGVSQCRGYVHVVEEGDTLYNLARKYDVKLFDIMRLNPYVNVYNLQIGDEICIPTIATRTEKMYVVNEGDTMADILQAFDMDFESLAKWNPTLLEIELPQGLILNMPMNGKNTMPTPDFEMDGSTDEAGMK